MAPCREQFSRRVTVLGVAESGQGLYAG